MHSLLEDGRSRGRVNWLHVHLEARLLLGMSKRIPESLGHKLGRIIIW